MKSLLDLHYFFANHPLTKGEPLRAWYRFVKWQIASRLRSTVVHSWVEGQRLEVAKGMRGATGNIYVGLHEFVDMAMVLHFLRPGDLFLDIGANVGSYTVLASGVCGAKTWAFEPDPDTIKRLERNIDINNLQKLVTCYENAVGATACTVSFSVGLDTVNKIISHDSAASRRVQQVSLDEVVGDEQPNMLKMDVEGFEEAVIAGGDKMLRNTSLRVLEIETVTDDLHGKLVSLGFERAHYNPFQRALTRENPALASSNALYVRDWDFVALRLSQARTIRVLGNDV